MISSLSRVYIPSQSRSISFPPNLFRRTHQASPRPLSINGTAGANPHHLCLSYVSPTPHSLSRLRHPACLILRPPSTQPHSHPSVRLPSSIDTNIHHAKGHAIILGPPRLTCSCNAASRSRELRGVFGLVVQWRQRGSSASLNCNQ